jgi:hypothetical protein
MPTAEAEVEVGIQIGPWVFGKVVKGEDKEEEKPEIASVIIKPGNPLFPTFFAAIPATWQANAVGMQQLCSAQNSGSATVGTRSWKLEGNQSAQLLQTDGLPDKQV